MTTTALHQPPSLGAVAREQLGAVRGALRLETIIVAALFACGLVMTAIGAYRTTQHPGWHMTIFFDAAAVVPLLVFAAFVPMGVWRAEDRARRSYHWSMPVNAATHTLLKALAGWAFLMATVVAYIVYIYLLREVAGLITHEWATRATRWWELVLAVSAPTLVYLVITAFIVGAGHPWRWGLVIFGTWFAALGLADGAQMHGLFQALWSLWADPRFGLSTALSGPPKSFLRRADASDGLVRLVIDPAHVRLSAWGTATAVWLTIALLLVLLAARRHPQD